LDSTLDSTVVKNKNRYTVSHVVYGTKDAHNNGGMF